ncbi:hypothetical protein CW304_01125 [Bacillus sp. UFRGS-B20]|nr:hypothetical protein CW304_01125 [Bacillus sp. UFRGS-B20]
MIDLYKTYVIKYNFAQYPLNLTVFIRNFNFLRKTSVLVLFPLIFMIFKNQFWATCWAFPNFQLICGWADLGNVPSTF